MQLNLSLTMELRKGISSHQGRWLNLCRPGSNIRSDMVEDLDKGDLRDMGITAIGDIKRILKFAKKENLAKYNTIKGGSKLSSQIEGRLKSKNVRIEQVPSSKVAKCFLNSAPTSYSSAFSSPVSDSLNNLICLNLLS